MQVLFKCCSLVVLVLSLTSCGLPMALARSAGSVVNSAAGLADAAGALGGAL